MQERVVYENTFNHFSTVKRRYRRMAVASFVLSLGVLMLYLVP
jgi:hypothetical protein